MKKKPEPIYKKFEEDLYRKIQEKELKPEQNLPSENQLAREYKMSRTSVRITLNNLKAKGLIYSLPGKGNFVKGYGPIRGKNKRITFVIPGLENSDFDIYKGIEDVLEKEGFTLIVCNSQRSIEKENKNILSLMEGNESAAIIFPNWGRANSELIYELKRMNYPFVLIDRYFPGIETDYVVTDNKKGGYLATEYFINLGHRKIGVICGVNCTAIEDRFQGYLDALTKHKIAFPSSLIKKVPQNEKYLKEEPSNGGTQETKELLKEKPTAIFATNDFLARNALNTIREAGLSVPEDISLIGFDNQKFSEHLGLTTIAQPFYQIGEKAAQLVIEKLKGEKEIKKVFLAPEMIVRKSCKKVLSE
ncbi:MAG: GntR family transcriptional regulator [Candidatus Omnitrophica bacterium]|nr:GntR family transcriptional regulator [Candidatus Omnitrophota bacterium]